jgi:hypothetical protein
MFAMNMSLNSGSATLNGNTIAANIASGGYGGGLCVAAGTAVVNTTLISGNTAASLGGGLYLHGSDATIVNSVVAHNQASGAGSGLTVHSSSSRLVHTTVARNYGGDGSGLLITGGGDVENYSSTAALTNVILVSHTVGIMVTGGNTATVNSVLWYATPLTVSTEATAIAVAQNEYSGDPAFAPDGFHLRSSSAAIDRGVEAGITNDFDGDHRPYRNGYDLGADEWMLSRFTYLPVILR